MFVVKCTKCKHDLKFRREIKENKIKCKYCGNVFVGSSVYVDGMFDTTIQPAQFQDETPEEVKAKPNEPKPVPVKPQPVPAEPKPVAVKPQPVPAEPKPVAVKPQPVPAKPTPVAVKPQPVPVKARPVAVKPKPVKAPRPRAVPAAAASGVIPRAKASSHRSSSKARSSEERDEAKERRLMFLEIRRRKRQRNRMILIAVLVIGVIGVITGVVIMSMTPPPEERAAAEEKKKKEKEARAGTSSGGNTGVQPGPGPGTVPGTGGNVSVTPPDPPGGGTTPPGPKPPVRKPPPPVAVNPGANKGSKYLSVLGCSPVEASVGDTATILHVGSFLNGTWDPFDPNEKNKKPNPCMEWAQVVVLVGAGSGVSEYRSTKFQNVPPGVEFRYSVKLPNGAKIVSQYCEHSSPLSSKYHGFGLDNFSRKEDGDKLIIEGDAKNPLDVDLQSVSITCDVFSGEGEYLGTAMGSFYLSSSKDSINAGKSKRYMMEFDMSDSSHSPDDNDLRFVARLLGLQA